MNVAEPFILRSVEISKRVLKEQNLGKEAIKKVILVGGPTLAPYFREILASKLGIPLDHNVDPLTVVASGAAVFAGTQRLNAAWPCLRQRANTNWNSPSPSNLSAWTARPWLAARCGKAGEDLAGSA